MLLTNELKDILSKLDKIDWENIYEKSNEEKRAIPVIDFAHFDQLIKVITDLPDDKIIDSLQILSIWILRKTNYKFNIDHNNFEVNVDPVGIGEKPTRYDFVCNKEEVGFMTYIEMVRYFYIDEMFDCQNPRTRGVRFNDENKVENLKLQFNKLIDAVVNSAKVVF